MPVSQCTDVTIQNAAFEMEGRQRQLAQYFNQSTLAHLIRMPLRMWDDRMSFHPINVRTISARDS
jgi:hypothetical protein